MEYINLINKDTFTKNLPAQELLANFKNGMGFASPLYVEVLAEDFTKDFAEELSKNAKITLNFHSEVIEKLVGATYLHEFKINNSSGKEVTYRC